MTDKNGQDEPEWQAKGAQRAKTGGPADPKSSEEVSTKPNPASEALQREMARQGVGGLKLEPEITEKPNPSLDISNEVLEVPLLDEPPLSETVELTIPPVAEGQSDEITAEDPLPQRLDSMISSAPGQPTIVPGEALQFVKYTRREQTLTISGVTPHGRRLTFEQREDRDGWYVVVAGRRRRPTERELGLVVASITQEMEAAMAPEGETEVRSAYRLAASSDQPGMATPGLQAYRDLLLDEAEGFISRQNERLAVVAIEYQAFSRFAIRHGHRIGMAFVRALSERLDRLFSNESQVHVFHKAGKSFRLIAMDYAASEVQDLVERITSDETSQWIVERVWGKDSRTHPDEVNFFIGIAMAALADREGNYELLAQRLNDDAYRAARLGQLKGHTSVQLAKSDYRTTIDQWVRASDHQLDDLGARMEDGPAAVMAEMSDYLNELVPADLEGMSVDGDVHGLIRKAIARDGFWQGTTAMRITGEYLVRRFLTDESVSEGQHNFVGGFALGDEFYGVAIEGERLYFAWGDLNSAGATRLRAGLERLQHAVGWRREDGGGIIGRFLAALAPVEESALPDRVREAALESHQRLVGDESMQVNDSVDIGGCLWTQNNEPSRNEDLVQGAELVLVLHGERIGVKVIERSSSFIARLAIGDAEYPVAIADTSSGPQVKLRVREAVVSSAVCILQMTRNELKDMLDIVREDNHLAEDAPMDILGFLRHIADILLMDEVKTPAKIGLALGRDYDEGRFVGIYSIEDVREHHPGLYYEAIHHNLLGEHSHGVDRNLCEMIVSTMLARPRPEAMTTEPERSV